MAIKSSRGVTSGRGTPQRLEGNNGDMSIRTSASGKQLFVKDANKWHSVNLDINTLQLSRDVDAMLKRVRKLENSTRNQPTFDAAFLRVAGSDSIKLKNEGASFKVRNADDSADAEISASRLQLGSIAGTTGIAVGQIRYNSSDSSFVASGDGMMITSFLNGSSGDTASFILSSHTADSFIQFRDGASARWAIGHDQSDSNKFKIEQGSSLADVSTLTLDSNAALELFGTSASLKLSYNADDYATFTVADTGDLTIATAGDGTTDSNLILDIDGGIELNADSGIVDIKNDTSSVYRADTSAPVPAHYFYNSANNADYLKFTVGASGLTTFSTVDNDGTRGNIVFSPNGKFVVNADMGGVYIDEISAAGDDVAGDGQLWVKDDTPNNLYFTDDAGNDIALTNNGKSRVWTSTAGGYKTNNNSATIYYFQNYPNYHSWGNSDSSPTSIHYTDAYSYQWCANSPGILTNISVTCRASDTGTTDPLKFYVYKGQPGNNATSTSLTLIGTTGTITPVASKQMFLSTDITSSNDFDAGDKLWIMLKKDSTSGNQDLYFAVTISGEYT
jgi:hypothetical protein